MKVQIKLWISNQDEIGSNADYTLSHLKAAGWEDGQEIEIEVADLENWFNQTFLPLKNKVAEAGWGLDFDGNEITDIPAPTLTARNIEAVDSKRCLQEIYSEEGDVKNWVESVKSEVRVTASEFIESIEYPVLFWASVGQPSGQSVAVFEDTEFPYSLDEIEGEVSDDGTFSATNLSDGGQWKFVDFNSNTIYKIDIFSNEKEFKSQANEHFGFTLEMRDECGSTKSVHFDNQPDELECESECDDWAKEGEWGENGAEVKTWWTLLDGSGEEIASGSATTEIEPDHESLISAACGDSGCGTSPDDHDWTAEGEGGLNENPGVWSTGGTSMVFKTHCKKCGLQRTERTTGSQKNPGEHDTVEYEMPESWCSKCVSEECDCDE
jgi:hypothetical protein